MAKEMRASYVEHLRSLQLREAERPQELQELTARIERLRERGLTLSEPQTSTSGVLKGMTVVITGTLPTLSREDKQKAIRILDERGAFTLRRAVEDVADAMGVSRITVYNYLNAIHR